MIKEKCYGLMYLIVLSVLLFSIADVLGLQCVMNDFTFYPVPDMPRPEKGVTFEDPVFHTNITRISDSPTDIIGTDHNMVYPGYPKHNIENTDGTMLIIQSNKYPTWHVWDAEPPYNKIKDIPYSVLNFADPDCRWDANNPDLLYCHKGTILYQFDVATSVGTEVHDFAGDFPSLDYDRIMMYEEGNPSLDSRYWVFALRNYTQDNAYVVYDKDNDMIVGSMLRGDPLWLPSSASDSNPNSYANWVGMSPSGEYAIITSWGNRAAIFKRDLSSKTHSEDFLETSIVSYGHNDVGYDSDGNEVLVFMGNNPNDGYNKWFAMIDIVTAEITWLVEAGEHNYHISVNYPGWAVISNYGPFYPETPSMWSEHEVYLIELTKRTDPVPRVWRVAHTHTVRKGYLDAPCAKMNHEGTKIFFGSGWDTSFYDEPDEDVQFDTYQIDLPIECFDYFPGDITVQPECDDSIDNDGDGDIDYPDDGGCGSDTDDDETDCGDGVCEGGETCQTCSLDCVGDHDNDGYDSEACGGDDCDDSNIEIHPDADELCDGIDNNCILGIDEDNGDCSGLMPYCVGGACVECVDDSDCTLPETCNADNICSEPVQIPGICNGLELLLHFDEDSSTVTDDSGNENHGTVNGATYTSSGRFSGAFEYDGVDDYIQISDSDTLDGYDSMTFSFWIKINEISEVYYFLSKYFADIGHRSYSIATDGSPTPDILFTVSSDGSGYETREAATDLTTDQWYHIMVVFDSGIYDVYVDGASVSDVGNFGTEDSIFQGLSDLFIGSRSGNSYFLDGAIDEVAIWNRALSSQEVQDLSSGSPITCDESSCESGADTDNSGEVSMSEVVAFIEVWKTGNVTIAQIIDAIVEWKDGC